MAPVEGRNACKYNIFNSFYLAILFLFSIMFLFSNFFSLVNKLVCQH